MKVEELYLQDKQSQIGVTFQRQPFETQVDIFPQVSPLTEVDRDAAQAGEPIGSTLTSSQMEEAICKVVKHQSQGGEEEFHPIPLKRLDSGPNAHNIQRSEDESEKEGESSGAERSRHQALLDEIDNAEAEETKSGKTKSGKKEGTLTRMKERLKSMRGEKDEESKLNARSISKIFNRVNPVSKASRESFSKVFHRIGDALQKKDEGGTEDSRKSKTMSLDRKATEDAKLESTMKYKSDSGSNNKS